MCGIERYRERGCVWDREDTEREGVCGIERQTDRETEREGVCGIERYRERGCVWDRETERA